MHAENLVVLFLGDDLHETVGLAGHAGARQRAEREIPDAHVMPLRLRLGFRQPDAADFRFGIGAARHVVVVDRLDLVARDALREHDAFHRRDVRELVVRPAHRDHIADRRDAGHVRLEQLIDHDVAAIHLDAELLRVETFSDRAAAGRDQQQFERQLL